MTCTHIPPFHYRMPAAVKNIFPSATTLCIPWVTPSSQGRIPVSAPALNSVAGASHECLKDANKHILVDQHPLGRTRTPIGTEYSAPPENSHSLSDLQIAQLCDALLYQQPHVLIPHASQPSMLPDSPSYPITAEVQPFPEAREISSIYNSSLTPTSDGLVFSERYRHPQETLETLDCPANTQSVSHELLGTNQQTRQKHLCPQCGKVYNRRSRARDCRYQDLGATPYQCEGQCGDIQWYVSNYAVRNYKYIDIWLIRVYSVAAYSSEECWRRHLNSHGQCPYWWVIEERIMHLSSSISLKSISKQNLARHKTRHCSKRQALL